MSNKEMMKKTKLFFSFEKQLNYINEMNKEGWKLVYIKGGCVYHFEKTEPDEYFRKLKYIKYAISRYVGEPKDRLSAHRRKEMNDEKQK